jgi:monoamine oxidase
MAENSVLILGAGVAGLVAADELSKAGLSVSLLEARERVGGRLHTIHQPGLEAPVELGAEFVHGARNATWPLLKAAHAQADELPDRHWQSCNGALVENRNFWQQLTSVIEKIDLRAPDEDFCSFLQRTDGVSEENKWLGSEYVEGFHAAPADRVSAHSIARAEAAAEREDGMRQFKLRRGYDALLNWLAQRLCQREVRVHCQHVVKTICWEQGEVEVEAATPSGSRIFQASAAVIALPLGVLKQAGRSGVLFEPELTQNQRAIESLEPGAVVKVICHFRAGFWPVKNFGFLHTDDPMFPTWWVDERGPLLTGWAGGPRAERLSREHRDSILSEAVESLVRIFKVERARIQDLLRHSWTHNWVSDPFARGAYSYIPVGMGQMPKLLAEPVSDTLFFAGEATAPAGDQGTIHGAVASGKRVAEQIRRVLNSRHRLSSIHSK